MIKPSFKITLATIVSFSLLLITSKQLFANHKDFEILSPLPQQGSMIILKILVDGEVYFNGKKLQRTKDNLVVFGVGRDAPKQMPLEIKTKIAINKHSIDIAQRQWKIERIDGLPASKVTPKSEELLQRIRKETKQVKSARATVSALEYFSHDFILPAAGRISGVYGSQRILNGQPKRPHYGIDIANLQGTPVITPVAGVVTLVHKDMFYSGGTLIIDHGYGISSTFIHLHDIKVVEGQQVKQGEQVATIGSTGRSTGPHLDWRVNWFHVRLDPQLLLKSQAGLYVAPPKTKQNSGKK
jgi:murein DD-endopeptidase MepM/ murein hydrolase activator NlpD